jgi:hypothetical protein
MTSLTNIIHYVFQILHLLRFNEHCRPFQYSFQELEASLKPIFDPTLAWSPGTSAAGTAKWQYLYWNNARVQSDFKIATDGLLAKNSMMPECL